MANINSNSAIFATHLPNGARIIELRFVAGEGASGVVLAEVRPGEYATWLFPTGNLSGTCWGHYFNSFEEAKADYVERSLKL